MSSRRDQRKKAYQFLYEKSHNSDQNIRYKIDNNIDGFNFISLAEMEQLKKGLADSSAELVAGLKTLLPHIANEDEIEEHLIKPFLSKSPLPE